jgi:hypothetical protein
MSHHHERIYVHPDLPPLSSMTTAVGSSGVAGSETRAVIVSPGRYHTAAQPTIRLVAVTSTRHTLPDVDALPWRGGAR